MVKVPTISQASYTAGSMPGFGSRINTLNHCGGLEVERLLFGHSFRSLAKRFALRHGISVRRHSKVAISVHCHKQTSP